MKMRVWMIGVAAAAVSGCSGAGMFGSKPDPMESMMAQQAMGNDMVIMPGML